MSTSAARGGASYEPPRFSSPDSPWRALRRARAVRSNMKYVVYCDEKLTRRTTESPLYRHRPFVGKCRGPERDVVSFPTSYAIVRPPIGSCNSLTSWASVSRLFGRIINQLEP